MKTTSRLIATITTLIVVLISACGRNPLPTTDAGVATDAQSPDTFVILEDGSIPLMDDMKSPDSMSTPDITPHPPALPVCNGLKTMATPVMPEKAVFLGIHGGKSSFALNLLQYKPSAPNGFPQPTEDHGRWLTFDKGQLGSGKFDANEGILMAVDQTKNEFLAMGVKYKPDYKTVEWESVYRLNSNGKLLQKGFVTPISHEAMQDSYNELFSTDHGVLFARSVIKTLPNSTKQDQVEIYHLSLPPTTMLATIPPITPNSKKESPIGVNAITTHQNQVILATVFHATDDELKWVVSLYDLPSKTTKWTTILFNDKDVPKKPILSYWGRVNKIWVQNNQIKLFWKGSSNSFTMVSTTYITTYDMNGKFQSTHQLPNGVEDIVPIKEGYVAVLFEHKAWKEVSIALLDDKQGKIMANTLSKLGSCTSCNDLSSYAGYKPRLAMVNNQVAVAWSEGSIGRMFYLNVFQCLP
ncbi:MAG: hypothetical protein ABIH87_04855 [bacterium]